MATMTQATTMPYDLTLRGEPVPVPPGSYVPSKEDLVRQIRERWGKNADWNVGGVDRAQELADLMYAKGVTSIDQLGGPTDTGGGNWQWKAGDQSLGFLGDYNNDNTFGSKASDAMQENNRIAWSARGDGNTSYVMQQAPDGSWFIAPQNASSRTNPFEQVSQRIQGGLQDLGVSDGFARAASRGIIGIDNYAIGRTLRRQAEDSDRAGMDESVGNRFEQIAKDEADPNIDNPERAAARVGAGVGAWWLGFGGAGAGAGEAAGGAAGAAGAGEAAGGAAGAAGAGDAAGGAAGAAGAAGAGGAGGGAAAAGGMTAGNWIDIVRLGAGLYAADQAGNRADAANAGNLAAAQGALDLSRQAQEWFQRTYESERGARDAAASRQNAISDAQLEGMNFAIGQARELDQYNRETFRPLEQQLVSDARTYDSPERRMQAAASAAADVDMSAAATRAASNRELQRTGVAPGSSRALALQADSDIRHAANRGGAMTNAVRGVEQQGYARRADAANLGRGIATTQATQQQIATTAGNASAGAAGQALGSTTSGTPTMQAGFNTGLNGLNVAGNLFNASARNSLAEDQLMYEGLGSIGGYLGSRYGSSDPKIKKGTGKMANAAKALKEVEKTTVQEGWEYDESRGAPPGSGGQKMIGPMATDVQRVSGEASAPGGQVIDLVKAQGRMTAAVQELSRRLKKVESMVAKDNEEMTA